MLKPNYTLVTEMNQNANRQYWGQRKDKTLTLSIQHFTGTSFKVTLTYAKAATPPGILGFERF